jgi:hypothetical protein
MVDPDNALFWVSWQDDAALEDEFVNGADAAITWGRERASRLGGEHAGALRARSR